MEQRDRFPDNEALVSWTGGRYTYKEFYDVCLNTAKAFMSIGLEKGSKIAVWATNYPQWVISQFASAMIGAVLIPINPAFREHEMEYVLKDSAANTLVLIERFKYSEYPEMLYNVCPELKTAEPGNLHSEKLPHLRNVIILKDESLPGMMTWDEMCNKSIRVSDEDYLKRCDMLDPDDVINTQYTSGTTGFPKGAQLSHFNIINNGHLIAKNLKFTPADRLCIPVPFYHCFGMVLSNLVCVTSGATMVVPGEYFEVIPTLKAVSNEKCTALHGVPTMFIAELQHPDFDKYNYDSLRTGIMAGAPCPIEVMKKVMDKMGMTEITICYGLTECSPVTNQTMTDDPVDLRVETVGKPIQHTQIKIIDPGSQKVLPVGEQGELCCRGPQVMRGYLNKPQETAETIEASGWLHTGDLAIMDENGYCKITGRIKDMIIRGGENIYPREIEEFLHTHPKIEDNYVFGIPDEKYGEEIATWIKLKGDATVTVEEIREFCKSKIAHQKWPRYIKFVDEFPMTVTGKVQKFEMRKAYSKELGL